uniref:Chemokine interleukin-8-like domain-containing protein n=1 Tax=Labrus bergylta TaxID=56723 RepID=A0A3Q3MRN1_9LABR
MVNSREMVKSTFVALVLVAVIHSVSAAEKLASCCKTVTKLKITEPITGYMIQRPKPPCVLAVIFQTQSGLYCIHLRAPWVRQEIAAIERAKAQAISSSVVPSSAPSLLSIITSTASRPASSTPLPSSSPLSSSYPSSSSTPLSFSSLPSSSSPLSSSSPTSSSSTPLFSSSPASFAPTSEMPADETFSEDQDE